MNKRKTSGDSEFQMFPNPKNVKLPESFTELLNDINLVDFDDEFTSSERTKDGQSTSNDETSNEIRLDSNSFLNNDSCNFLDLSTWKRCVVEQCHRDARTCDLNISGHEDNNKCDISKTNKQMVCRLQHSWSQCRIEIGDIVSILAIWNDKLKTYCVSSSHGFVVVRPDFLVSGTTVVSGLFCMRKAVLQDRFKGIEAGIKIVSGFTYIQKCMCTQM